MTPLRHATGYAVMGEVFGVPLPVAALEGLLPNKAKG